jgi:hypothetical protein
MNYHVVFYWTIYYGFYMNCCVVSSNVVFEREIFVFFFLQYPATDPARAIGRASLARFLPSVVWTTFRLFSFSQAHQPMCTQWLANVAQPSARFFSGCTIC